MVSLGEVFDGATVAALAGSRVFGRGLAYFDGGKVELAAVRDGRLQATVRGTMPYMVELWVGEGGPDWSCTCPAAEDGSFCKHAVATALSLEARNERTGSRSVEKEDRALSRGSSWGSTSAEDDDLAAFVEGLGSKRLTEIVLDQAASDWRLRELLLAEVQAARGAGPDTGVWRRRIDRAFAPGEYSRGGFITYYEAPGWAAGIDDVIDALDGLCDTGHHDAAARLAEHAHRCAEKAIEYVDDSDGWLTGFSERLSELHLRACEADPPDPAGLAARLVELELGSDLIGFDRCAATYREVLGAEGLAAFRVRLDSHRTQIDTDGDHGFGGDFKLQNALAGWALGTRDPDFLIEVYSLSRPHADDYLDIVDVLDRVGRVDEAMDWARRGLAEWGSRSYMAGGLRNFLAGRLRDRGEDGAAVELYWQAFASDPSVSAYSRLLLEDDQQDWLRRCGDHLRGALSSRQRVGDDRTSTPDAAFRWPGSPVPQTASALVSILLYEGMIDEAWQAANDYGAGSETWLTLARARERDHPLDAIAVYEQSALATVESKNAKLYQSAVDLAARIRRLADSAGEPGRFSSLLERLRAEHRPKRKLQALLDAQGW